MTHDKWWPPPACAAVHTMNIAAANSAGFNGNLHFFGVWFRRGRIFESQTIIFLEDQSLHLIVIWTADSLALADACSRSRDVVAEQG